MNNPNVIKKILAQIPKEIYMIKYDHKYGHTREFFINYDDAKKQLIKMIKYGLKEYCYQPPLLLPEETLSEYFFHKYGYHEYDKKNLDNFWTNSWKDINPQNYKNTPTYHDVKHFLQEYLSDILEEYNFYEIPTEYRSWNYHIKKYPLK